MTSLICSKCGLEHDSDLSPDTGECFVCGGLLLEPGEVPLDHVRGALAELSQETNVLQKLYLKHGVE